MWLRLSFESTLKTVFISLQLGLTILFKRIFKQRICLIKSQSITYYLDNYLSFLTYGLDSVLIRNYSLFF